MTARRRVVVLHNPVAGAGRGEASARRVATALQARGHEVVAAPTRLSEPREWLDPVLAGTDALVVVGGDGAMRLAAPSAVRCGVAVCHHPLGTENLFARAFPAGGTAESVVAAVEAGTTRRIDVGLANGRTFLIMASVGFDAEVVRDLAAHRRGGISHLSYAAPILRRLASYRGAPLTIRAGDRILVDAEPGIAVVANLPEYGVRLDPAPGADPADGLLDVVFLPAGSVAALAATAIAARCRRLDRRKGVRRERAAEIVVERHAPTAWQVDGDPPEPASVGAGDADLGTLHLSLCPAALPVLVR